MTSFMEFMSNDKPKYYLKNLNRNCHLRCLQSLVKRGSEADHEDQESGWSPVRVLCPLFCLSIPLLIFPGVICLPSREFHDSAWSVFCRGSEFRVQLLSLTAMGATAHALLMASYLSLLISTPPLLEKGWGGQNEVAILVFNYFLSLQIFFFYISIT